MQQKNESAPVTLSELAKELDQQAQAATTPKSSGPKEKCVRLGDALLEQLTKLADHTKRIAIALEKQDKGRMDTGYSSRGYDPLDDPYAEDYGFEGAWRSKETKRYGSSTSFKTKPKPKATRVEEKA